MQAKADRLRQVSKWQHQRRARKVGSLGVHTPLPVAMQNPYRRRNGQDQTRRLEESAGGIYLPPEEEGSTCTFPRYSLSPSPAKYVFPEEFKERRGEVRRSPSYTAQDRPLLSRSPSTITSRKARRKARRKSHRSRSRRRRSTRRSSSPSRSQRPSIRAEEQSSPSHATGKSANGNQKPDVGIDMPLVPDVSLDAAISNILDCAIKEGEARLAASKANCR